MMEKHPKRSSRTGQGFTLIEVVVVVIILAIVAAMVLPSIGSTGDLRSRSAARMMMADLEFAQSQAIVTQVPITVTFDTSGNSYRVSNASGTLIHPITKNAYVINLGQTRGMNDVTIASADFGSTQAVTFDSLGAPDNSGAVSVACKAHTCTVTVSPVTGRVTVSQTP